MLCLLVDASETRRTTGPGLRSLAMARETSIQTKPRRTSRQRLTLLLKTGLVFYIVVLLLLASLQSKFIFPGHERQGKSDSRVKRLPQGAELVELALPNETRLVGVFGLAKDDDGAVLDTSVKRPTIVYFYGNGNCMNDTLNHELELYRRMGVNVFVVDYYGYGMSGGEPSERNCYDAANRAYDYVLTRKEVDANRIIAAGWSLGGAVAIDLASRRPVAGLIAFSSFTSMIDMSHRIFPFAPARLLLKHRFESEAKIRTIECPILIGHGSIDPLIPARMGRRLYTTARAARDDVGRDSVLFFEVQGAIHNDFYDKGGEQIDREVRAFLRLIN